MSKTYCRLDNGGVVQYIAAYSLDSTAEISNSFEFIGIGVICWVGKKSYNGKTRFKFYITKRVKNNVRRKNSNDRRTTC